MKIPRFVKEYANYQKSAIKSIFAMPERTKRESIEDIDRVYRLYAKGLITIDEAMDAICHWEKFLLKK